MSGISSGTGFFSGIDTNSIIEQMIAIESRPKQIAQRRIQQIQLQRGAFLDLNSKLQALQTSASAFRTDKIFRTKAASVSDEDVLGATADTTAAAGTYQFLVDRLVSSQQLLSRGFADRDLTGAGATSVTIESARARLDTDVALADLNNGAGIQRGKIVITDSGNRSATVDLSRATSVQEVLDTINGNGVAQVTASVSGGRFVIRDNNSTSAAPTVADATGSTTATSLGLTSASATSGGVRTGATVYAMNRNTTIASLNDGNGAHIQNVVGTDAFNFMVRVTDGGTTTSVRVNIGDVWTMVNDKLTKTQSQVSTVGGVIDRINTALSGAGFSNITASIGASEGAIKVTDQAGTRTLEIVENNSTTAADLGILTSSPASSVTGRRILAGLNTTLARTLNGGSGIAGDGQLSITARDGTVHSVTIDQNASLSDIATSIESQTAGKVRLALNSNGTGLVASDTTNSTTSNLIITGTNGSDSAASLGISTGATGVASATFAGGNLQKKYISASMLLSDNPLRRTVGTGKIRITDSVGANMEINVTDSIKTFHDLIDLINDQAVSRDLKARARINAKGDGLELYEDNSATPAGSQKMKVEDVSGGVARALNIAGESKGTLALNTIDGSFERTITLSAADTLQQVADKINTAGAGVGAAIIRDGNSSTSYRLSLSSTGAGRAGRFILDAGAFDFGFSTLDAGQDARMFYGSADPARGVAITRSSNSFDDVVSGVKLDAKQVSSDLISVSVSSDTEEIVSGVKTFVTAFNTLASRIQDLTKYDAAAERGGALLGDGTAIELRSRLFAIVQSPALSVNSTFTRLSDVGVKIGKGAVLELDEDRLREALQQDPEGVENLFAARVQVDASVREVAPGITVRNPNAADEFSSLGVASQLENLAKRYIDSTTGVLSLKGKSFDSQIKLQNDRISFLDDILERRRASLERQFASMESTIGRLQQQQGALSSIG